MLDIVTPENIAQIPAAPERYLADNDLSKLLSAVSFKANVVLTGPKGVGKSLAFHAWAAANRCLTVSVDCAEDSRRSALVGQFLLTGGSTRFVLGPVATAVSIANSRGACLLILEEISCLPPSVQKVLNPLLDFRREILVAEVGTVYSLNPDAKLWITGTMNSAGYGGTFALNEDLKSRFRMLAVTYPTPERELRILEGYGRVGAAVCEKLLTLAAESRLPERGLEYALSTRDLTQIISDCETVGLREALRLQSGKFEIRALETYKKRVHSIFAMSI